MAQCIVCKKFLPPGFTRKTNDNKADKCIFCDAEKDVLVITNEHGEIENLNKNEIVNYYMEFLKKFSSMDNIKNLIEGDDTWENVIK